MIIARDVRRYRLLMLPAVLEKLSFGLPAVVLYASDRVAIEVAAVGTIDLVLGALFAVAYATSRGEGGPAR